MRHTGRLDVDVADRPATDNLKQLLENQNHFELDFNIADQNHARSFLPDDGGGDGIADCGAHWREPFELCQPLAINFDARSKRSRGLLWACHSS